MSARTTTQTRPSTWSKIKPRAPKTKLDWAFAIVMVLLVAYTVASIIRAA